MRSKQRPKVIVIGAGFGGIFAVRTLARKPVEVLLIDRQNYHTFTPLLYQVATCALDPSEIAHPIRSIFNRAQNVRSLMGEVTEINFSTKSVLVNVNGEPRLEYYDYLIIAAGSEPAYFGNEMFKDYTFELRTLKDAVALRNHILRLFEQAVWVEDVATREAMTTLVVVGGGPTGLETAGALYELYNHVLDRDFGPQRRLRARVILVELLPNLLASYPKPLQEAALKQIRSLGIGVILQNSVKIVSENQIQLEDGRVIPTCTVVWSAGVEAPPITEALELPLEKGNRIVVNPTLEVDKFDQVYAVGDIAYLEDTLGVPYPMLIPVAKQQGILAAKNILRHISSIEKKPFKYHDRGIMATIGRRRAVAWIYNKIHLQGFTAWLAWLGLHLLTLMGFRNQVNVLVNWIWNYLTYDRSVRIILD